MFEKSLSNEATVWLTSTNVVRQLIFSWNCIECILEMFLLLTIISDRDKKMKLHNNVPYCIENPAENLITRVSLID